MEKELISVIVPVYKVEQYLDDCVRSIINQTYKNLEIILVDDGSPDNCGKMCDAYAEKDERVLVIHQVNSGVSVARNTGVANAHGEYIMFVDSDDWVDTTIVEHLYSKLKETNADMALCGHYRVISEADLEKHTQKDIFVKGNLDVARYVNDNWGTTLISGPVTTLYKKDKMGKFREGMSLGEDALFKMDCFLNVSSIVVSSEMLYYYRCYNNSGSLSNSFSDKHFENYKVLYDRTLDILREKGDIKVKEAKNLNLYIVGQMLRFMRAYCAQNDKKASLEYIRKICKSEWVHLAARSVLGKFGLKSDIKAMLVYLRMSRLILWTSNRMNKNNV